MTLTQHRWYAVQTQSHGERKAAFHLERQGFAIYLPQYLKRRRHARRVELVRTPLFPRYLFVGIDMALQRWRSINGTIGVSRLVCNGEDPATVPPDVIAHLKDREGADGLIRLDLRPRFAPGDKIRVLDGVFEACLGLFEGITDNERVAILLDLLGRKVRVKLDAAAIAAA
jgi:transcriptional antiterminator RfaH